jgi:hypothetical protein
MDAHQQKMLQEQLLELGRKSQIKSDLQHLHEFVKKIPAEIIANVKKTNPGFQIADLLKREIQQEAPELARTNPTEFRVDSSIREANSTNDESSNNDETETVNPSLNQPNLENISEPCRKLPSSELNDREIERTCEILNARAKELTIAGTRIVSANLGHISDPHVLRLLVGIYSHADIFLISEVMWEREQVLSETSWPIDFRLLTHEKMGTSNLAYSIIMYN